MNTLPTYTNTKIRILQFWYQNEIYIKSDKGNYRKTNSSVYWIKKRIRVWTKNWKATDVSFTKPLPTSLPKIKNFNYSFDEETFSWHIISSVFSENFYFERLKEISLFYAAPPLLTFLSKKLHCSYVNCNEFNKHERLFMIIVQHIPKRWNIIFNLSKYVCELSTPWWYLTKMIYTETYQRWICGFNSNH